MAHAFFATGHHQQTKSRSESKSEIQGSQGIASSGSGSSAKAAGKGNIFADLKKDHEIHRDLLKRMSDKQLGKEDRKKLLEKFRVELTAHAAAEEESLYAAMLAKPKLRDDARHSVAEHKEIDDLLNETTKVEADSAEFWEQFEKLKKRYLHHVDEEEQEMFENAAEGLSKQEEARIAAVFEKRKPQELQAAKSGEHQHDDRE